MKNSGLKLKMIGRVIHVQRKGSLGISAASRSQRAREKERERESQRTREIARADRKHYMLI